MFKDSVDSTGVDIMCAACFQRNWMAEAGEFLLLFLAN